MTLEEFINKWSSGAGGAERSNFQPFMQDFCDLIGTSRPDAATGGSKLENYVFEAPVKDREYTGNKANKRIDLYKRDCFILEAKQSFTKPTQPKQDNLFGDSAPTMRGKRQSANRALDELMLKARAQAEGYVFRLPTSHNAPPFIILCDVGHCFEIYADFTGTGRSYTQFPDRKSFRIFMEDLENEETRELLRAIWENPQSLNPTLRRARTTREIAKRLAQISKSLENKKYNPEDVAQFLMRCVFTMFAEDVKLLPENSFTSMLADAIEAPQIFVPMLETLWRDMDKGSNFHAGIKGAVRRFNGGLFKNAKAFPLGREEIGELYQAAQSDWKDVEPAIFGTLLEQALDPKERASLGAHFTPRPYVDRLVNVTIIEPLREEWNNVRTNALDLRESKDHESSLKCIQDFRTKLTQIRVLDPACGTGNFLYASLELMKRLEAEVMEFQIDLGDNASLSFAEIDPHQFLGLELNPRAAAIAELVVWIGFLQWHYKTHDSHPAEPILKDFKNIKVQDAVLTWDEQPNFKVVDGKETCTNPRRPDWPEAEFIIGNPPFIGGSRIRDFLGGAYAEALWKAHPKTNNSADFVMYWWDRAADTLTRAKSKLQRFGFITTSSITQEFQRRTIEKFVNGKTPLSIIYAIADHPWTKATKDAASIRIAMTTARVGGHDGLLEVLESESGLDTDDPHLKFSQKFGKINADLTIGLDINSAKQLIANSGLVAEGIKPHGMGFAITLNEAEHLTDKTFANLPPVIKPYFNGRDLAARPRKIFIIDLNGFTAKEVLNNYPKIYQHLLLTVKPDRDKNNEAYRRENWWLFGRKNTELRNAISDLKKFVVTVKTSKHRFSTFIDGGAMPDSKLIAFALDSDFHLGVLSSFAHMSWALANTAFLGPTPTYTISNTFGTFPFPDCTPIQKEEIGKIAEELDAHRKRVLELHPHLTMTELYNVLEEIKKSKSRDGLTDKEKIIFDDGLILILKELHENLDKAVIAAYGWDENISDQEILEKLVALNHERAEEEKRGIVKWLRPEYQKPLFAKKLGALVPETQEMDLGLPNQTATIIEFPKNRDQQVLQVRKAIEKHRVISEDELLRQFKNGTRNKARIYQILDTLDKFGDIIRENGKLITTRAA